jgi:hypothetical protein
MSSGEAGDLAERRAAALSLSLRRGQGRLSAVGAG